MAEINVTPFVDVMLVLLIVFMVTAPLLVSGVTVDLPKATATALPGQDEPISISVDRDGQIFISESEVAIEQLAARLDAITAENTESRIFVRGDKSVAYGQLMNVMSVIHGSGYRKVALVTSSANPGPVDEKQ